MTAAPASRIPSADPPEVIAPPPRPALVELAAAILILTGGIGLVTAILATLAGAQDPFAWLTVALNLVSIVLGLATRLGRLWILTLNYAAVLGFLDMLGASTNPQALMVGLSEVLVVVILVARKPWFDAVAAARASAAQAGVTGP